MIVKAVKEDLAELRELWKICFPDEDPGFLEFFGKNRWDPSYCYVSKEDGKIVSTLTRIPHAIMFNGKVLSVSMITAVATLPDYRNRGYMHELLRTVTDACEHSELLTFIKTEEPALYEPFGFRSAFPRNAYMIRRRDLKRVSPFGIAYEVKALDMLKVYSAYIRRFNGFYTRDLRDFVTYRKEIISTGGKIIGYFNSHDRIDGYAAVRMQGTNLYVDELVYLDSVSLVKLLNACLAERPYVHFHTSGAENLDPMFPNAEKKKYDSVMVRINNFELFNKLFGADATNVSQALSISKKPLNMNESY